MPKFLTLLFKVASRIIIFFSNLLNIAVLFFSIWCILHQIHCEFVESLQELQLKYKS